MSRPSKNTPEVREAFLAHVSSGLSLKAAAEAVGVGADTIRKYRRKDDEFDASVRQAEQTRLAQGIQAVAKDVRGGDVIKRRISVAPDGTRSEEVVLAQPDLKRAARAISQYFNRRRRKAIVGELTSEQDFIEYLLS